MDERAAGTFIIGAAVALRLQPEAGHRGGLWRLRPAAWREGLAGKAGFELGAAAVLGGG